MWKYVIYGIIPICIIFVGIGQVFSLHESMPRKLEDGRVYRQWCCPKCETWNKNYGHPYECEKCGHTLNW